MAAAEINTVIAFPIERRAFDIAIDRAADRRRRERHRVESDEAFDAITGQRIVSVRPPDDWDEPAHDGEVFCAKTGRMVVRPNGRSVIPFPVKCSERPVAVDD
jgi:hypothetical protein